MCGEPPTVYFEYPYISLIYRKFMVNEWPNDGCSFWTGCNLHTLCVLRQWDSAAWMVIWYDYNKRQSIERKLLICCFCFVAVLVVSCVALFLFHFYVRFSIHTRTQKVQKMNVTRKKGTASTAFVAVLMAIRRRQRRHRRFIFLYR